MQSIVSMDGNSASLSSVFVAENFGMKAETDQSEIALRWCAGAPKTNRLAPTWVIARKDWLSSGCLSLRIDNNIG